MKLLVNIAPVAAADFRVQDVWLHGQDPHGH